MCLSVLHGGLEHAEQAREACVLEQEAGVAVCVCCCVGSVVSRQSPRESRLVRGGAWEY